MKTALIKIVITAVLSGAVTVGSKSQNLPDSLASYLEIAARNNPGVRQALLGYQAALHKVPQAGSLPDPELSAGILLKPMELMNGKQMADFQLMQMFPWFGVLRNAKDEMSLMANAKYEQFRDVRAGIWYDVQKSWYELYRIQAGKRTAEKNISLLGTIERLALTKYQSPSFSKGTSSAGPGLSDLYRIRIEMLSLEERIESLKTSERAVTAQMNSLLNRPPLSPLFVDTAYYEPVLPFAENAIQDSILANNPMLTMLEYEKQSLEARERMVKGMSYPMAGIGVSYTLISRSPISSSSMNGDDMIMPMVSVTLPVYRKKYRAMKSEVQLMRDATEQGYRETVNSLTTELYSVLQMFQDASRRTRLYENQRNLASVSLDLILKDYSSSLTSLTDVLRLQQELYEYELKLIESNADMNIAAARITRLIAADNE
jgi:outer membrane protein TolC